MTIAGRGFIEKAAEEGGGIESRGRPEARAAGAEKKERKERDSSIIPRAPPAANCGRRSQSMSKGGLESG
jgi:hypothetical protein